MLKFSKNTQKSKANKVIDFDKEEFLKILNLRLFVISFWLAYYESILKKESEGKND